MLLAAAILALRNEFRKIEGLSRASRAVRWVASVFLLIAVPFLWSAGRDRSTLVVHLTLMAAIAAPSTDRQGDQYHWHHTVSVLPALVLAGGGLFTINQNVQPASPVLTPTTLAITICGGLAARVLGEALGTFVNTVVPLSRTLDALYLLLTLLVGGSALVNLWQRGAVWEEMAAEKGLAGTWLAWTAAWLSPREERRLRSGLAAAAALLLTFLSLRAS